MKKTPLFPAAAALLASLLLGACGGGSNEASVQSLDPTEVPASASASTAAFVAFTGSLASNETREPLDVTRTHPPTSETEEPLPIR